MKKAILLLIMVLLLTGCTSIKNSNLDEIVDNALNSTVKAKNTDKNGYRYYLPKGINIKKSNGLNEVLISNKYVYYLYVDIVSYNSKLKFVYNENEEAYYSKKLYKNGKNGYIEINNYKNNQYLIEIMYNYAKIEVVGYERDINNIVAYAMSILTSVTYNDSIIKNIIGDNVLETAEEGFNIFEIVGSDNYLEFSQEEVTDEEVKDPDYIK